MVEDTKTLVAGAASSQEQLAVAAQNAVTTIVQLSEVVKSGAASLGSPNREAQVMLINAVKDVASALSDLMKSTKFQTFMKLGSTPRPRYRRPSGDFRYQRLNFWTIF